MKKILFYSLACLFFIAGMSVLNNSCKHDATGIDTLATICFEKQVLPIFSSNCAMSGCHDGSGELMALKDYSSIKSAVSPGKPFESDVYNAITAKWVNIMPPSPNNPLSEEQRTIIYLWILQGAENTTCEDSSQVIIPNDSICYSSDIAPILNSSCAMTGCHDASTQAGEVVLNSYSNTKRYVVAGNPNSSLLYEVITATEDDLMPPYPRSALTSTQIHLFYDWISEGAKNINCAVTTCDTTNVTFSGIINLLVQDNCRGCHNSSNAQFGIKLETYSDVATVANNGLLIDVLKQQNSKPLMPPGAALSSCKIRQFELWVNAGAQNNK
jgi:hypothetical protein